MLFTRWFGVSIVCASGAPVVGDVVFPRASHASIACRSYVKPSAASTGCVISSIEMGQHKFSGTSAGPGGAGATAVTTRSASAVERPTSTRSSNDKIGNVVASICSRAKSTARRPIEPPRRLHRSTPRFGASGSLGNGCTGYVRLRTRPSEGTSPPPPRRRQRAPPKRKTPIASLGAFLRAATALHQ